MNYKKKTVFFCVMKPSSLVVADVSEEPDEISPPWSFKFNRKYSSPFHVLTFLSAYCQTLAWSSFSWTEANQNALCVTLLVCVYISSGSSDDVSHPKCRSHRVTPKSDKGVARVCFPSALTQWSGCMFHHLHLLAYRRIFRSLSDRVADKTPYSYLTHHVHIQLVKRCHTPPFRFTVHV